MKNLLIMRHAKSDWGDSSLSDFDRPLNKRGERSAPFMGKELIARNKVPELIISSPANRAKTTAELVAEASGYESDIQFERDFYFGYVDEIINIVSKLGEKYERIMIIGHNPTLESLVATLSKKIVGYAMPTAAVASLLFDIDSWKQLDKRSGSLEWLIHPKELM